MHNARPPLSLSLAAVLLLPLLALLPVAAAGQAAPAETFSIQSPAAAGPKKAVEGPPSQRWGLALPLVQTIRLDPVDVTALLREDVVAERLSKVVRLGVRREFAVSAVDGDWFDRAGGNEALWAADVVATEALGMRLHFAGVQLPAGSELAVYVPRADGGGVERDLAIYPALATGSDFLTPTLFGERVRIEYRRPAGSTDAGLPFRVDALYHLYRHPYSDPGGAAQSGLEKAAGTCHNDVTCFPQWADVAKAVGGVTFNTGGGIGFCTGQLLNSQTPDFTPYFLTANHCINTGGEAASAEFYWFYQTASCGGPPPNINNVPRSQGASLLSTNSASDYTLLLVNGALPNGLFWSGWTSAVIANGTPAVAIHHPQGDFKRISFGNKNGSAICGSNNLLSVDWTDAPTEPGSSGSGIFRADNGQLFGQLFFGPSACGNESFDCYGSFNVTYKKVKNLLKVGSDDNSEQNDSCPKARVAKKGNLTNRIVKINDTDWYKIAVPRGKTLTITLTFIHGNGDIDLGFHGSCTSGQLFTSNGIGDSETISVTNVGSSTATAFWQVFLFSDTRNSYNMNVTIN